MPRFTDLPLHTPRLRLRPPRPGDADALFAIHADPQAMRYWSTPPWTTPQQAVERIEADLAWLEEGSSLRLMLEPLQPLQAPQPTQPAQPAQPVPPAQPAQPIIGSVSLFQFDTSSQRAEIGYILAPAAWGRGLMHEALAALVALAFERLDLRRLEADVDPRNARSAHTLERLGFRQEGLLRERWVVDGEVSDSALFGLLAREWRLRADAARTADGPVP